MTTMPGSGDRQYRLASAGFDHDAVVRNAMIRAPEMLPPAATIADVRRFFDDDHVHMALIVQGRRLLTTLVRSDIAVSAPSEGHAMDLGTLHGRTIGPDASLAVVWEALIAAGHRRRAVVDEDGTCLGLLCLKRSGRGFCSDAGVQARKYERAENPEHSRG